MSDTSESRDARPGRETLHCLDLFSGLGGFSSAFEDSGRWSVTTVEIEEEFAPDIQADVLELRPDDLPDADLVLASPPCKCFSRAAAWTDHFEAGAPQTVEARESVALVYHTLGLIKAINPRYWFVENPMGSKIKQYLGEPTGSVTYCQYGTTYQKPTYLWGDHPPMTYRWCSAGDDCHEHGSLEDERDERPLPRDPAERAKVPYGLSKSIREAVEEAIDSPQPEQSELPLIADGGPNARPGDEVEQSGPGGTLLLTDEPARPLRWHHSVEFDGYKHTTACGREIDTDDIRDVFLDPADAWHKRVKPANSCPTCYDSIHQRGEFEDENSGESEER